MVCSSASPKDFGQAHELVKDVVYPVVSKPTLQALVKELRQQDRLTAGESIHSYAVFLLHHY